MICRQKHRVDTKQAPRVRKEEKSNRYMMDEERDRDKNEVYVV